MKTLLILRHAKSSWKDPELPDHDRPLNKRGKQDAPQIGRLIRDRGLVPDLILCSTAKRARSTCELVVKECGFEGKIRYESELYTFDAQADLQILKHTADKHNIVMLVGHNPGLEELLHILTGENHTLSTAALAQVILTISNWSEIGKERHANLANLWRPKEL